ncbi:hypothetical protein ACFOET_10860 [Parapedobacter deserti]|uniref:DUF304 domain-containing protein n=1 Tax=Parapedobacter deserti TaxID=1912957 RepID=A0ABV7JJ75_9SPHI
MKKHKPEIDIEKHELTDSDKALLRDNIRPRTVKNALLFCLIYLLLTPIMPYFPAKVTHSKLIDSYSYGQALVISALLAVVVVLAAYYLNVVLLDRDIRDGVKYVYRTKISGKLIKGNKEFRIDLSERPKNVKEKIFINQSEYYNWLVGDMVEVEYLRRSRRILSYKKVG